MNWVIKNNFTDFIIYDRKTWRTFKIKRILVGSIHYLGKISTRLK